MSSSNSSNNFLIEKDNGVLTVTNNQPEKRNALSRAALAELGEIFLDHREDKGLIAAVLTGAGEKSFAAGGDLKEFESIRTEEAAAHMSELGFIALKAIKQFPVPVIAAVNGFALGGGAELAMACDYRIAAEHAKIGFIQGKLGISSSWGGAIYLAERIGASKAMKLLATGEVLDIHTARKLEVIDVACDSGECLKEKTKAFIEALRTSPPQSLRTAKAIVIDANNLWLDKLRNSEHQLFVENWVHEEHWRRVAATNS